MVRGLFGLDGVTVTGRMTGEVPRTGELNPDIVREALGLEPLPTAHDPASEISPTARPHSARAAPTPTRFRALNEALNNFDNPQVFSDIGCYTLAALPPLEAVHSCVAMGASIGMAAGAAHAGYSPAVAAIGDSTFSHGGITPLLSAVQQNVNLNVLVVDNRHRRHDRHPALDVHRRRPSTRSSSAPASPRSTCGSSNRPRATTTPTSRSCAKSSPSTDRA